ncbi:MAG: TrbG/VirB9 family P-type conjugative transfer protein [Rhodospirillum sp.]|nr:TrbG/VirB9 family P-type conjugative transfer protein [Rhodospirillum sp.]MCF8501791.1 TrbG/VirB9 family P-type conjugative transfer protein [Rhodospirillum sp.]
MTQSTGRRIALAFGLTLVAPLVHAQTPINPPPLPVPEETVQQIEEQSHGDFGGMKRTRGIGQMQEAWDTAPESAAVFLFEADPERTYKIRLREFMVTVIELPKGEVIEGIDLGDSESFEMKERGDRRVAIKPLGFGFDSNMTVYGRSGTIYPFYLRAEGYNSHNVPDLVVRIDGFVHPSAGSFEAAGFSFRSMEPLDTGKGKASALSDLTLPPEDPATGDFVPKHPFDPSKLKGWGEYSLWGDDDLKPETVFRDDDFTYIKFGDRWKDIELPTAYVVVDGIDENVNTRIQGSTFIVESTRPLITLKSGMSYLCVKYGGE